MCNSYYLRVIIYYKSRCEYILIFVHCIFTTNKFKLLQIIGGIKHRQGIHKELLGVWDSVGYVLFIFVDMYLWLEAGLLNFFEFLKRTPEGFYQFYI